MNAEGAEAVNGARGCQCIDPVTGEVFMDRLLMASVQTLFMSMSMCVTRWQVWFIHYMHCD